MDNLIFRPFAPQDKAEVAAFFADMGEKSAAFFNVENGNERRTMEFFENRKKDHRFFGLFEDGLLQPMHSSGISTKPPCGSALRSVTDTRGADSAAN